MYQLSTTVSSEEENEQRVEGQGLDGEEVGRPDVGSLVIQEGAPRP